MNAIALVLCGVIAGADARETIPTSVRLHEVINNVYSIDKIEQIEVAEDGASLQTKRAAKADGTPSDNPCTKVILHRDNQMADFIVGEYQLKVVPCPGHPNFLLAGYEAQVPQGVVGLPSNESTKHLLDCFCVLIDTDQNIVIPLDQIKQRLYLTDEEIKEIQTQCELLWTSYVQQIEKQTSDDPFYGEYRELRRQFITPPPFNASVKSYFATAFPVQGFEGGYAADNNQPPLRLAGMNIQLQLLAAGRKIDYQGMIEIQRLLRTTIAMPAAEYFGGKTPSAKSLP